MWYNNPTHKQSDGLNNIIIFWLYSIAPGIYTGSPEDHLSTFSSSSCYYTSCPTTTTFRLQSLSARGGCPTLTSITCISFKIPSPQKDFALKI
jgi:hypothetical protein